MLTAKEVAYEVTRALDSKKGMDIKLLRISEVSSLADYFIICTGTSNTHVKTLCDHAEYVFEQLRSLAFSDLDAALQLGLEMTLTMLRQQGREISPESRQALVWLKGKEE